jgi:hypothetical protein
MVDGGPWENATVTKQKKMSCDAPEYSPQEIVESIYRWDGENWSPRGFDYFHPLSESRIRFIDTDDQDNRNVHLFEIIAYDGSQNPPWVDPLLVTDRGMVVQKDLSVGGFLGTNQGEVWIGHGRNTYNDVPKIIMMHAEDGFDTLHLRKFNENGVSDPATLNLGKLEVKSTNNVFAVTAGDNGAGEDTYLIPQNPASGVLGLGTEDHPFGWVDATYVFTDYLKPLSGSTINVEANLKLHDYKMLKLGNHYAPPVQSSWGNGTKIALYEANQNHEIGLEGGGMWFKADGQFRWYAKWGTFHHHGTEYCWTVAVADSG